MLDQTQFFLSVTVLLRLGIQEGFVFTWSAFFASRVERVVLLPFKSESLHFVVKALIKLCYKSKHLEMHSVQYICFSLDFSCIM